MGLGCNHPTPAHCAQAILESGDGFRNEMARRAAIGGQFYVRRDTSGNQAANAKFVADASGVVTPTVELPKAKPDPEVVALAKDLVDKDIVI
jgi:hypothetical protein